MFFLCFVSILWRNMCFVLFQYFMGTNKSFDDERKGGGGGGVRVMNGMYCIIGIVSAGVVACRCRLHIYRVGGMTLP